MPSTSAAKIDTSNGNNDEAAAVYRHTKRPEWGLAIMVWDRADRRAYQFEDGRTRVFKEGYYSLIEPAERPGARPQLVKQLEEAVEVNERHENRAPLEPVYPFESQLEIFTKLYSGGFADEKWIDDHRGGGSGKRLKAHREPALEEAAKKLSAFLLNERIQSGDHDGICEDASELLKSVDLVPVKAARKLGDLPEKKVKAVAEALNDVLHGSGKYRIRFRAWVRALRSALGTKPKWRLSTALPALVHPNKHVCVRPSTFKRQAGVFAPDRVYSKRPRARSYANFRHVANRTKERLVEAGHEPRDLLDVYDFIWVTLRPAAAKHLEE